MTLAVVVSIDIEDSGLLVCRSYSVTTKSGLAGPRFMDPDDPEVSSVAANLVLQVTWIVSLT